ncbi:hypothetical protein BST81_15425 [Leptolyngbya sp. 'hensonii']|uniref:hypothetical protein n=1 Tax=Leptolyngbya sp. 'hensonii' TaxID=1922337 RepID=UPI00094F8117|nr:hypothetical protein [Leptolyngbya sp. 'hensonii']OLP17707.1 hypothetical protein BST81_15425 [Leptolyngbya sp. 'hensonii']
MNPVAEILLEQITQAQKLGQKILTASGLDDDGVIYAFATADTLVINCRDYETTWRFDEAQGSLNRAIAHLQSSIQTISIERVGRPFYCW